MKVEIIKDNKGNKKEVRVPYETWERIQKRLKKARQEGYVRKTLTSAFKDLKSFKEGKLKPRAAEDLLNEL